MNEEFIKKVINCKLNAAEAILDCLPPKVSQEIKQLGKIILEEVSEKLKEEGTQVSKKPKTSNKLESIPIE